MAAPRKIYILMASLKQVSFRDPKTFKTATGASLPIDGMFMTTA